MMFSKNTGYFIFILIFILGVRNAYCQETGLRSFLKNGELSGNVRNFLMTTSYLDGQDYTADALGVIMKYQTPTTKGWQFGLAGSVTSRVFSNDLYQPDPVTGKTAKFENQLFDTGNPTQFTNLTRLEELFVKYKWQDSYITYGKIKPEETPLLNQAHGRMVPYAFQGFWLHHKEKNWGTELAWIHKISQRGTTEWYSWEDAFGQSGNGLQPNDERADYKNQYPTKGVAVLGINYKKDALSLNLWDFYIDKVINTAWIQLEYTVKNWQFGGIYSFQNPNEYNKKLEYKNRYVQPEERGQMLSLMAKYQLNKSALQLSYTRSPDKGRYLFPRELGRDKFYTFMARSPLEGFSDMDIFLLGFTQNWKDLNLKLEGSSSRGFNSQNHTNNKYNLNEYYQVNANLTYKFGGKLKGLTPQILYVFLYNKKEHNPLKVYPSSDFHQINFITNFTF